MVLFLFLFSAVAAEFILFGFTVISVGANWGVVAGWLIRCHETVGACADQIIATGFF